MGHNSWKAKVRQVETIQRAEVSREMVADARAVVEKWNADLQRRKESQFGYAARERYPQFSPHIGAALLAGKPILRLLCPGCQQEGYVDLRKVVRPHDFPIGSLYDALVCTFGLCRGDGPRPVMLGVVEAAAHPVANRA